MVAVFFPLNDVRAHFGLGDASAVDSLEIHWPSGAIEPVKLPEVDRILNLEESKGMTGDFCPACGAAKRP